MSRFVGPWREEPVSGCEDPVCTLEDCDACDQCFCHECNAHIPEPHECPCNLDDGLPGGQP